MQQPVSIFWFRRDLRLEDNAGLYYALRSGYPVLPIFIYDTNILDGLEDKYDKRLCFIRDSLKKIQVSLVTKNCSLYIIHTTPAEAFTQLLNEFHIAEVFTNEDYEPYAIKRDAEIAALLARKNIPFKAFKDHVIFAKNEVQKEDGSPYTVYTPYSKRWKLLLNDFHLQSYPVEKYESNFLKIAPQAFPSLTEIGFKETTYDVAAPVLDVCVARNYDKTRNLPALKGTSGLSVHLRFGTISVRQIARQVRSVNETLFNELIWREFFSAMLWHYPQTVYNAFKPAYDNIEWVNNEENFMAWCEGRTGYPIVDAGMRELNETGLMHNRSRMVTASFLCKHLLTDWRWGEAYFAKKLLDYDMSQNIGNWQWVAGCGTDAAPYFRVFNPIIQQAKFDPEKKYIRHWIKEYGTSTYTHPIVDHDYARLRCLNAYKKALDK